MVYLTSLMTIDLPLEVTTSGVLREGRNNPEYVMRETKRSMLCDDERRILPLLRGFSDAACPEVGGDRF
jgi:hypothetical protein